jgi:uncharacterized protein (DUF885 family)
MRRTAVLLLALLACACASTPAGQSSITLAQLADEHWQHALENSVTARAELGLPIERLPDPSYAQAERDAQFARTMLERIAVVDTARLSDDERITLAILRDLQDEAIDAVPYFWLRFPVTPYSSPIRSVNAALAMMPLTNDEQVAQYARILGEYATFLDRITAVVQEQRRRGILVPKAEIPIARTLFTSAALAARSDAPAVREAIATKVDPAFARLAAVFNDAYVAAAPETVGLAQYPGGTEAYRWLVRKHTTLDLSPEEIHQLGLDEVARIDREMAEVRVKLGFTGTRAEFQQQLRNDPRLFAKTPDEIGERLTKYMHEIQPHLPTYFARQPHALYDVKRLSPALEPAMTFGYYQAPTATDAKGYYLYNGSKLEERSLLFAAALMAHELAPGHHFQIATQIENDRLPMFRRKSYQTAFVEGWGEYSASLAREMGLYDADPYDLYGRLMMDMMLSVRLVVDTGMNHLGWSRERAMAYMREHTLLGETEIATESLRYAVDIPGQALAYKIGSLRIMDLRRRTERELGAKFDIAEFHEWVIGSGSMPLRVLDETVARKAASYAARR